MKVAGDECFRSEAIDEAKAQEQQQHSEGEEYPHPAIVACECICPVRRSPLKISGGALTNKACGAPVAVPPFQTFSMAQKTFSIPNRSGTTVETWRSHYIEPLAHVVSWSSFLLLVNNLKITDKQYMEPCCIF